MLKISKDWPSYGPFLSLLLGTVRKSLHQSRRLLGTWHGTRVGTEEERRYLGGGSLGFIGLRATYAEDDGPDVLPGPPK